MSSISDINLNAPVEAAQGQFKKTQDFMGGQNNQIGDFTNKFSSFVNKLPSTQSMADTFSNSLNLPNLRNNANSIQQTITDLPNTYSSAVRGTDVNNNQLQRIIGQRMGELAPMATNATNALNSAENQLGQRLGYAQQDITRQLMPIQNEASLFGQQLQTGANMFSQNMKGELDSIIAKMNGGIQLTEGELNRANQLAMAEKNNQASMNQLQYSSANSQHPADTSYQTIGGQVKLIDNRTGQVISTLGSSSAGGGQTGSAAQMEADRLNRGTPSLKLDKTG